MMGKPVAALVSDDLLRYQTEAQKKSGYDLIVKAFPLDVEEHQQLTLSELAEMFPCPVTSAT